VKQMMSVMAPMRDGVRLSCDIRMPDGAGPFPAALLRTPYNKAMLTTSPEPAAFVNAGYAFVTQDTRGKHESGGEYTPFRGEDVDGYDTVMWVAEQPWCDGNVVMTGASYPGWTQFAAAKGAPPPLRAITPSVMATDPFRDVLFSNGVPRGSMIWWAIVNGGRSQRGDPSDNWAEVLTTLPLRDIDKAVGYDREPILQEWFDHPTDDAFWEAASIVPGYGDITAAALLIGGWYDVFSAGLMRAFAGLTAARGGADNPLRLVMGPWGHSAAESRVVGDVDFGPGALLDIAGLRRGFLDAVVRGTNPPAELAAPLRVFMMGANEWRNEQEWPPARATSAAFHLGCATAANSMHGDGTLSRTAASPRETDEYTYDPLNPAPTIGGAALLPDRPPGPIDQRPAERRDDVLCYTSDVLDEPLGIMGFVKLELYASSSAPDTDFIGRLCDVRPDGRSINLCDGILRTRFREGMDREVRMTPGEAHRFEVDMGSTAHAFLPGHRIRLEVTSSCFPRFMRNLNTGGSVFDETTPMPAKQTIHHSPRHPSKLILPVV